MSHSIQVRLARLLARVELPIILAIAPALMFPTPTRLLALAVVPPLWVAARIGVGRATPATPLNTTLWILLAMTGASLFITPDLRLSLGKVAGVVLGTLFFWAVVRQIKTDRRLKLAVIAFLLSGGVLTTIGLLGARIPPRKLPELRPWTDQLPMVIRGVPGAEDGFNPNAISGCLILFIPLLVALIFAPLREWLLPLPHARRTARWGISGLVVILLLALLAVMMGAMVLLQSRGAWLGLIVALAAFMLWHGRVSRTLLATAATGIVIFWSSSGTSRLGVFADATPIVTSLSSTVEARIDVWSRALYCIRQAPLTGIGMNTFREVMLVRYPAELGPPAASMPHAHNVFLQTALDLGLPGMAAYAMLWVLIAAVLVRTYRGATVRIYRVLSGGIGAGLLAHFVFNMTDAIALGAKPGILFWFSLAVAVGLQQVAAQTPRQPAVGPATGDSVRNDPR